MNNIIKNTMMIFSRHKEYIGTIVKGPILITLIYSFVFAFQAQINIALINDGSEDFGSYIESTLEDTELIKIQDVSEDEVENKIQGGKIEFAVIIDENNEINIVKTEDSEIAGYMEVVLNGAIAKYNNGEELVIEQNDVDKKGLPISNSLGIIIFKMIAAASLLAELLIMEKKTGIAQRVAISKTGLPTYLGGRGIVFFLNILIFIFAYFATAFIFNFDFGMRAPFRMAVIFMVMGIFTTAFGMFLAAFIKDEAFVWNVGVMFLLPTSLLSGALLPFESMPKLMQRVGSIFPQRWIASAVEILQDGGAIKDAALPLMGVLAISIVMFVVAAVRYRSVLRK